MLDGLIDDLGDGRTAGFPSTAQFAFLIIGPLLIVALLMVGLPTVRWVGRLRVLAEACTVSPAVLFMGYTLAANVLPRQAEAARANLAMVLAIGLIDLVALTVCALVLVESRTTPRLMMMLSFLFLLVGDILLGLDYWTTVSIPQGMFLLPWLGSALFFALAALHARPATVRNRTVRPLVRSMVVYTPVLIAYLIGFYQLVWGDAVRARDDGPRRHRHPGQRQPRGDLRGERPPDPVPPDQPADPGRERAPVPPGARRAGRGRRRRRRGRHGAQHQRPHHRPARLAAGAARRPLHLRVRPSRRPRRRARRLRRRHRRGRRQPDHAPGPQDRRHLRAGGGRGRQLHRGDGHERPGHLGARPHAPAAPGGPAAGGRAAVPRRLRGGAHRDPAGDDRAVTSSRSTPRSARCWACPPTRSRAAT